jgi:hypothetical protein
MIPNRVINDTLWLRDELVPTMLNAYGEFTTKYFDIIYRTVKLARKSQKFYSSIYRSGFGKNIASLFLVYVRLRMEL